MGESGPMTPGSGKKAATAREIHSLIANRWSPLAFDAARPVERDKLIAVFEAARWAPSCFNEQPWRYLVCDRFAVKNADSWEKALNCLVPGNQRWAKNAPVLIAALSHGTFARTGKPNRWRDYDTGAASENMCLQACDLGLAIHQMGGFDSSKLRQAFGIPDDFEPIAMIALGYPGEGRELEESDRKRQSAPRERRKLGDTVFLNEWESGIEVEQATDSQHR